MSFRLEALAALSRHGLLTTRQIRTIVTARTGNDIHAGSAWRAINQAADAGLVDHVCATVRSRERSWFLTAAGTDAVGTSNPNPLKMTRAIASGPTAAHLALVNAFGVAVVETLGPDAEVSWVHEQALPLGSGRHLRPDAVLSVLTQHGNELVGGEWFIEADRGTEPIATLVDKLANYLSYRHYRPPMPGERTKPDEHWRTRFRTWPRILFVFDCSNPQARIQRLAAWAGSDPRLQPHWAKLQTAATTTTAGSPLEAIYIPTGERKDWLPSRPRLPKI